MRPIFSVAAILALALVVGFGPATVAGQETAGNATATTTATATPTEEPTSDPAGEGNESEISGKVVDDEITLTDWSYDDGTFVMTFHHSGERPKQVTLTESTQREEGASYFSIRRERLLPGTSTVTLPARSAGGEAAAGITSSDTIEDTGQGVTISTGQQGSNPFRNFGGTTGVLSGTGISMGLSGLAAGFVVWREESGVVEA